MRTANPYRGQIVLPLPAGDLLAVVDTNALRLLMEDLGEDDINATLAGIQRHPLDRLPRLCWHGVRTRVLLEGGRDEVPAWEAFAAQFGQLDFEAVSQEVGHALDLGGSDGKKKDPGGA